MLTLPYEEGETDAEMPTRHLGCCRSGIADNEKKGWGIVYSSGRLGYREVLKKIIVAVVAVVAQALSAPTQQTPCAAVEYSQSWAYSPMC